MKPNYYLAKTDPSDYPITRFASEGRTVWDGVTNAQALQAIRAMRPGDRVFIYHSNTDPAGIAGIGEVVAEAHADPSQFDKMSPYFDPKSTPGAPRWQCVDVGYVRHLPRLVTLAELKAEPRLCDMVVVQRGSRLSVQPVTPEAWRLVLAMVGVGVEDA